ncbi:Helix-turn-helix domain-containing protein [Chitinophaga jiangningensis]|uniref:Helix-turn-helix domain-containing protein n=1 Tax=Chitinophaga jiangningensis TaxID=1419482 RepID=A0A1M6WWF2_9BACT|nr:helix-turn-helix domain-containing protein [Chitinophaga jiangningensis]SHK97889.1 Helix-turn-helix domain-containing protein [Chitinophaga jiangningensis]
MDQLNTLLPYYTDINDFLASIPWPGRTTNPDFYCLRLTKQNLEDLQVYKPPFKRSFYFLALLYNSGSAEVNYGSKKVNNPESYLVFHSPNLLYSFSHNNSLEGYIIYFKPACYAFFKPDFHKTFPLFDVLHTNLFKFELDTFRQLAPHFEEVFLAYERSSQGQHMEARIKLLGLLYFLESFANEKRHDNRQANAQQLLLQRFTQLVNHHYIDKRTVKEYADMLSVTANYLSQSVKTLTGKNALSYIADRLTNEARSLIQYTDFEISRIAYQLNFSDPANFGKFFKKQVGLSPLEYRRLHK